MQAGVANARLYFACTSSTYLQHSISREYQHRGGGGGFPGYQPAGIQTSSCSWAASPWVMWGHSHWSLRWAASDAPWRLSHTWSPGTCEAKRRWQTLCTHLQWFHHLWPTWWIHTHLLPHWYTHTHTRVLITHVLIISAEEHPGHVDSSACSRWSGISGDLRHVEKVCCLSSVTNKMIIFFSPKVIFQHGNTVQDCSVCIIAKCII